MNKQWRCTAGGWVADAPRLQYIVFNVVAGNEVAAWFEAVKHVEFLICARDFTPESLKVTG